MKQKIIAIFLYLLFVLTLCTVGRYWCFVYVFHDIIRYYHGGILKYVFFLILLTGMILPIVKYRKHKQKWVLPMAMTLILLITSVFNMGILWLVEGGLKTYSKEKWEEYRQLRVYMIDDLEMRYLYDGNTEEYVKTLLGEPDEITGEEFKRYEYYVSPGFMDVIMFYVQFENGLITKTGKYSR